MRLFDLQEIYVAANQVRVLSTSPAATNSFEVFDFNYGSSFAIEGVYGRAKFGTGYTTTPATINITDYGTVQRYINFESNGTHGYFTRSSTGLTFTGLDTGDGTQFTLNSDLSLNNTTAYFKNNVGIGTTPFTSTKFSILGSGTTSATNSVLVKNSSSQTAFAITDNKKMFVATDPSAWDGFSLADFSGGTGYILTNSSGIQINDAVSFSWKVSSLGTGGSASLDFVHNGVGQIALFGDFGLTIGAASQPTARLELKGNDSLSTSYSLKIYNSSSNPSVYVDNAGHTGFGLVSPTAIVHAKGSDTTSSNYALKADSSSANILSIRNDHTLIFEGISSGFTGSQKYEKQDGTQTGTKTFPLLRTISTIATSSNQMVIIKGTVAGFQSNFSNSYGSTFFAVFYNNGGVLTQVSTTDLSEKYTFGGAPTTTVTTDGGTNIIIQVTGVSSVLINWVATYEYTTLSTNI